LNSKWPRPICSHRYCHTECQQQPHDKTQDYNRDHEQATDGSELIVAHFQRTILPNTHYPKEMAVQKIQVVVQKKCKPITQILNANCRSVLNAHLKQDTNVRRNTLQAGHPSTRKMKRCALCHGKLGLGVRFRNIWNGAWWVHVRFCSVRCEATYQDTQTNAATHRWHATLADGTSRS
jgi:hypothetical protein